MNAKKSILPFLEKYFPAAELLRVSFIDSLACLGVGDRFEVCIISLNDTKVADATSQLRILFCFDEGVHYMHVSPPEISYARGILICNVTLAKIASLTHEDLDNAAAGILLHAHHTSSQLQAIGTQSILNYFISRFLDYPNTGFCTIKCAASYETQQSQ